MFLTGIGTAVPPRSYTQSDCWEALQREPRFFKLSTYSQGLLKKVLSSDNGICTRHLVVENLSEMFALTPDALYGRFSHHAPILASQAAERAFASAGILAEKVDAVIVSTCTGYMCPGLSSYVIEQLGLRPEVQALDLVGQGCGAAMPNLRTAHALIGSGEAQNVLSVCVEICSAAFYWDEDPGVLISACLFGDGAAAAVLSAEPGNQARRVEWKLGKSVVSAVDRDYLRFEQRGGMLRNILSRRVPALAAKYVEMLLDQGLHEAGLQRSDLKQWVFHAGGRDVLNALQTRLGLQAEDLVLSTQVLRDFGNISSPCVLFVLDQALKKNNEGGWWWMSSFGAGFSCYGALLKVD